MIVLSRGASQKFQLVQGPVQTVQREGKNLKFFMLRPDYRFVKNVFYACWNYGYYNVSVHLTTLRDLTWVICSEKPGQRREHVRHTSHLAVVARGDQGIRFEENKEIVIIIFKLIVLLDVAFKIT